MTLADPQITRRRLENTIRSAYCQRKVHEIAKLGPAAGGMPRQQQQQQHWSRGGGMPRRQQQQQHWSRGGSMPRQQQQQQQWSRGGGIPRERSSHTVPPARQTRQQQPPRGIPSIGVGGIYDCGATTYTTRRTHLPRQAHQCVRYTAVAVAANMGTSPNTVLHRVGLRELAAPAASMVTCGGTAPSAAVNLI